MPSFFNMRRRSEFLTTALACAGVAAWATFSAWDSVGNNVVASVAGEGVTTGDAASAGAMRGLASASALGLVLLLAVALVREIFLYDPGRTSRGWLLGVSQLLGLTSLACGAGATLGVGDQASVIPQVLWLCCLGGSIAAIHAARGADDD